MRQCSTGSPRRRARPSTNGCGRFSAVRISPTSTRASQRPIVRPLSTFFATRKKDCPPTSISENDRLDRQRSSFSTKSSHAQTLKFVASAQNCAKNFCAFAHEAVLTLRLHVHTPTSLREDPCHALD